MIEDLPREIAPPPHLKNLIAARMQCAGAVRRSRAPWYVLAAALILAIAGSILFVQRPAQAQPRYILLLYESPGFSGGSRQEYSAWARGMRPLVAGGEELGGGVLAINPPKTDQQLAGYFLINA
ncbi:MAG: hypothetical protein ACXVJT_14975, partial [Thermoanaerobaculia bacterium]